jgi:hypothetical protein
MTYFFIPRSLILAIAFALAANLLHAQGHEFHFFPVKDIALEQQGLVGMLGNRAFLLSLDRKDQLNLFVFDLEAQQGLKKDYPFEREGMAIVNRDHSILFVSQTGKQVHLLELDETGAVLRQKKSLVAVGAQPAHVLSSADKSRVLVYSLERKGSDSSVIAGTLFDSAMNAVKHLAYAFHYEPELDMDPAVVLDNQGNTHVLVYDKTTNYRMSSDLTLNTIPYAEELIISETFNLNKIKLRTMQAFQNSECNCIQTEGLYVDGMEKNNRGVYSIAFPPGRKNELAPRFIRFRSDMIQQFKKGFSATEEAVQDNIQLQDLFYSDSGSVAVFSLRLGDPQKLQSDPINSDSRMGARGIRQTLAVSRGNDMIASVATAVVPASTPSGTRVRSITNRPVPTGDPNNDLWPFTNGSYQKPPPLSSRASGRNAPKLMFVKLHHDQGFSWFTSRSLDVFSPSADLYNKQFIAGGQWPEAAMIMYQADDAGEPSPVFVTVRNGRQTVEKFGDRQLVFSPLQLISPGHYGSLYLNLEKDEAGILLINPR